MVIFLPSCCLLLYTLEEYLLVVLTCPIANLRVLYPTFETEIVMYSEGNRNMRVSVVRVCEPGEGTKNLRSSVLVEGAQYDSSTSASYYTLRALKNLFEETMEKLGSKM